MNQKSSRCKRWLAFVLSLALILTNLNIPVLAADYSDDIADDNVVYSEEVVGSVAEETGQGDAQDLYAKQDNVNSLSIEEVVGASSGEEPEEGLDIAQVTGEDSPGREAADDSSLPETTGLPLEVIEQDLAEDETLVGVRYSSWEALQDAIDDAQSGETITLDNSLNAGGTYKVLTIPKNKTLTLDLNGYTLDRKLGEPDQDGHVIEVLEGAVFTLEDSSGGTGMLKGGYGVNGGAVNVHKNATMYMYGGTIKENHSEKGGGVCNKGTFEMYGGTITGNTATDGGGIWSNGTLRIDGGTIDANTAEDGGGIFVETGNATVTGNSSITNNIVTKDDGGGIVNKGTLTVENGLISGNKTQGTSSSDGGGIWTNSTLTITGGAISNNEASCDGGGIYIDNDTSANAVTIGGYTSINGNTAGGDGGGIYADAAFEIKENVIVESNGADVDGGGIYTADGFTVYDYVAVQYNTAKGKGGGVYAKEDITVSQSEYNNARPYMSENTVLGKAGNVYLDGADIILDGALEDGAFFGITLKNTRGEFTEGLNGAGREMDSGGALSRNNVCRFFSSDREDYCVGIDASSKEAKVETYWKLLQDTIDRSGNTKYIYLDVDAKADSSDSYIKVNKDVTIDLGGHTLDRQLASSDSDGHVIEVMNGGKLTVTDSSGNNSGTITGGYATNGGGINVQTSATLDFQGGQVKTNKGTNGGGIRNNGTATFSGGVVTDNDATEGGGGIYNTGTLTLQWPFELSSNTSSNGGGIYNTGNVTIDGGVIKENTASVDGGGIYNNGDDAEVTMNSGSLDANSASDGGGIFNENGTVTISDPSEIINNTTTREDGGGIVNKDDLNISGGTISGNEAARYGGGIWTKGTLTLTGGTITENTATSDGGGIFIDEGNSDVELAGNIYITDNTSSANGGGIAAHKKLTVKDYVIISGNDAVNGGGIWSDAALNVTNGEITGNEATTGNGGGVCTSGKLTMDGGTIAQNTATTGDGGGIWTSGSLSMSGGAIESNTATAGSGGGIFTTGILTLTDGTVVSNNAKQNGGGICTSGTLNLNGGYVQNNGAEALGAGIYAAGSTITMKGKPIVNDNNNTNLYLANDQVISIKDTLDDDSLVGITMKSGKGVFTDGLKNKGVIGNFMSDDEGLDVALTEDGEASISSYWSELQGRIFRAVDGDTITLYRNVTAAADDDRLKVYGKDITIDLNGYTIDRGLQDAEEADKDGHVFQVANGATLTIVDYSGEQTGTITGGYAVNGGGINISSDSTVHFESGTIKENRATKGGGILNRGTLEIGSGIISQNTADVDGGGIYNVDGGSTTINGGVVERNVSTDGGGIFNEEGTVTVKGSTEIKNNMATDEDGGGIVNKDVLTIEGGTISDNDAKRYGGGIWSQGDLTITHCSIANNSAESDGGGIFIDSESSDVVIGEGTTIDKNTSFANGGGIAAHRKLTVKDGADITNNYAWTDGGGIWTEKVLTLENAEISDNSANTGNGGGIWASGTVNMDYAGIQRNKAFAGDGAGIWSSGTLNLTDGPVMSNEAKVNGGGICSTGTLNLNGGMVKSNKAEGLGTGVYAAGTVSMKGSPEVNENNGTNLYLANDQKIKINGALGDDCLVGITLKSVTGVFTSGLKGKGGARNFVSDDDSVDVGINDKGEAIISSYWNELQGRIYAANDGDTVTLTRSVTATSEDDRIKVYDKDITLDLNGFTMDRGLQDAEEPDKDGHVIQVYNGAVLTIVDSSENKTGLITGGNAINGGGINIADDSEVRFNGGTIKGNNATYGGGILNRGTLTIGGGIVTENTSKDGGGVYNTDDGSVTVSSGQISKNTCEDGGGIFNNEGTVTVSDSAEIKDNTATAEDGGGIVNKDELNIQGGTISGNSAARYGGGIWTNDTLTVSGGDISDNTAGSDGGGIYIDSSSSDVTLTGGTTVSGNKSSANGGGIATHRKLTIDYNVQITGNTAATDGGGVWTDSTLTMNSGAIESNTATNGAGGGIWTNTTVNLNGGSVTSNVAKENGGGICTSATLNLHGGTIQNNTSSALGAGVYTTAAVNMQGDVILNDNNNTNLYLANDQKIKITDYLGDSLVGITLAGGSGEFTTGLNGRGGQRNFISDDEALDVGITDKGEARITSYWNELQGRIFQAADGDTITLQRDVLADPEDTRLLVEGKNITIDLFGFTIDRGLQEAESVDTDGHVIQVDSGATLTIVDTNAEQTGKITGGNAVNGGGINITDSTSTVNINGGTIEGNKATDGGGIFNRGTLTIAGGVVKGNTAEADGGGIYNTADGSVSVSSGGVDGNTSTDGGGIFNDTGTVTVSGTAEIKNNTATVEDGGGIVNKDTLTVEGGTISGNETARYGGGIWTKGSFTITGGTITGNKAGNDGGGIYLDEENDDLLLSGDIVISDNESSAKGGGIAANVKLTIQDGVQVTGNTATMNGGGIWTNSTLNLYGGTFENNGSDSLGGAIYPTGTTNLKDKVVIQNNTGSNLYLHNNKKIKIAGALDSDTRIGITLPGQQGVFTDGLKGKGGSDNFTSDNDSLGVGITDNGEARITSYWNVLQGLIYQASNGDTIELDRSYKAATGDTRLIVEDKNITLDLNGFTLDRGLQEDNIPDTNGHVIQVESATLTIIDSSTEKTGKLTGGNATNGGAINVNNGSAKVNFNGGTIEGNNAESGGGILNRGTLTVDGGIIKTNTASDGGGIYNDGGTVEIKSGQIISNTCAEGDGGGVYNDDGTVTVSGGSIESNTSTDGGGIFNEEGTVTVKGSAEIKNNTVTNEDGGGIVNKDKLTVEGGTISGNTAARYGGGIWSSGTLNLNGGVVEDNTGTEAGGGIYSKGTMNMKGSPVVTGNTATNLYLVDKKVKITDTLGADCEIGVTLSGRKGEFTTDFDGKGSLDNFTSDDAAFTVDISGNKEAMLATGWTALQGLITRASDGQTVVVSGDFTAEADETCLKVEGKNITLDLNGHTLDRGLKEASADVNGHVIQITNGATLTIIDSSEGKTGKITGGNAGNGGGINVTDSASTLNFNGGTVEDNHATKGGGILVRGTLTIDGGIVKENTASEGGGVYNDGGTVELVSGQIDSNTSSGGNGGGVYNNGGSVELKGGQINDNTSSGGNGGGVYSNGSTVEITGGQINGNTVTSNDGGGIYNDGGTVTFISGKINDNTSTDGGGIFNQSGTVTVKDGTEIKNNTVTEQDGGGIVNKDKLTVEGGFISGNTAKRYGGGIWSISKLYLYGGTIVENSAETEGGGVYVQDGSIYTHGAPVVEDNTVNNVIDNIYLNGKKISIDGDMSDEANVGVTLKDTKGVFTSGLNGQGRNPNTTGLLSRNSTSAHFASDRTGYAAVVNTDGEAEIMTTWRLMQNAINAANDNETITVDLDVTADADDVRFEINRNLIVDLNGHTIDEKRTKSNTDGHIFQINSGARLVVRDSSGDNSGKITGGWATNGGAINVNASGSTFVFEGGTLTGNKAEDGGAILNRGTVTMSGGVITENTASNEGGGIYTVGGNLTITGGSITDNTAEDGGGIFIESGTVVINETAGAVSIDGNESTVQDGGGIVNKGTLTITDATISNNTAKVSGGGIWSNNELTITGATISQNKAHDGGGIWIKNGDGSPDLTVNNAVIDSNTAEDGGGIFIDSGTAVVEGTTQITNNIVTVEDGGGIVNKDTLTIEDSVLIAHNSANRNGGGIWTDNELYLYGGTITENDAEGKGSGIYVSDGEVYVYGNPVVQDNEKTNLYLTKGQKLDMKDDEASAQIGISMEKPGVFTTGKAALQGDITQFTSDDTDYKVSVSESEFALTEADTFTVKLLPGQGTGSDITEEVKEGSKYYLPDCDFEAPIEETFAGWKYTKDGETYDANAEFTVEGNMIFEAQWEVVQDTAIIQSATVLFQGMLRIRIKYTIPETYLADGQIVFVKNGKETRIALSDGAEKDGYRFYELGVKIPEYADEVVAKLVDGEGKLIPVQASTGTDYTNGFTYSVKTYAENKKASGKTDEMKALAKALDEYGKAAQIYFQYGDYQGLTLSSEVKTLTLDEMDVNSTRVSGTKPEGVGAVSQTVYFDEDNSLRVYFTTSNKNLTYTLDGKAVTAKKSGKRYYVRVPNVEAPNLAEEHVIVVSDGINNYEVTTSCLAYAKSRAQNSDSDDMKNLAKALYLYYKAASAYPW